MQKNCIGCTYEFSKFKAILASKIIKIKCPNCHAVLIRNHDAGAAIASIIIMSVSAISLILYLSGDVLFMQVLICLSMLLVTGIYLIECNKRDLIEFTKPHRTEKLKAIKKRGKQFLWDVLFVFLTVLAIAITNAVFF